MIWVIFYFGLLLIAIFLLIRVGVFKSWAVLPILPGLMSARMFYAALPLGLGFIGLSILPALPNYNPDESPFTLLLGITIWGGPLMGFLFMYRPPRWLDPKWLQWLKQEYGYCLPILIEEAQQMNRWDWEREVRTQKGMQQWIDTVYERRKEDIDFYWQYEKLYRVEQQMNKQNLYRISAGMEVEGYIPVHRQGDNVLVREEIDAVVAFTNDLLLQRIDKKK